MAVEKVNSSSSLAEVVDRILDKGIVVDAWVRVSLVGIELLAIEARVVIASVETYLKYAEAVGLTAQAALVDKQLSYSRLHEREADHVGIQTLTNAGFNPQAMASFFSKMDRQARQVGLMPSFLLTHPSSQERNADSTLRSQQYPNKGNVDSLDYQLIRRRLLAIIDGRQPENLAVLQQRLNNNPQHEPTLLSDC